MATGTTAAARAAIAKRAIAAGKTPTTAEINATYAANKARSAVVQAAVALAASAPVLTWRNAGPPAPSPSAPNAEAIARTERGSTPGRVTPANPAPAVKANPNARFKRGLGPRRSRRRMGGIPSTPEGDAWVKGMQEAVAAARITYRTANPKTAKK